MLEYLTRDQVLGIFWFELVVLVVVLSNRWLVHRARRYPDPLDFPMVSILIPARNEERSIADCVLSLLAQDYPTFEVLVLDDQSTDCTRSILTEISTSYPQLKVLDGQPPIPSQLGKNWACSQLAHQAQGELFLFTDADTIHHPHALRRMVAAMLGERADMLAGFPRQLVLTWGERLLVPFFGWAIYCFNPLFLAYNLRLPLLSAAVGQMMLFKSQAYWAVGGHDEVSGVVVDDLVLAQRIKAAGLRWRLAYIADLISCRMYRGYDEAFRGFTKNLFAAFNFRLLPFAFVFIWLGLVFWLPMFTLLLSFLGLAPSTQPMILGLTLCLSLLLWLVPYVDMGIPFGLAFLYPFTMVFVEWVAFQSLWRTLSGKLTWKGRSISKQPWTWL